LRKSFTVPAEAGWQFASICANEDQPERLQAIAWIVYPDADDEPYFHVLTPAGVKMPWAYFGEALITPTGTVVAHSDQDCAIWFDSIDKWVEHERARIRQDDEKTAAMIRALAEEAKIPPVPAPEFA
jgi:hypothetical protein